jgi:hypothetical protein
VTGVGVVVCHPDGKSESVKLIWRAFAISLELDVADDELDADGEFEDPPQLDRTAPIVMPATSDAVRRPPNV